MSNEHSNQKEPSSETTDLTVCGICLSLIDNPKVLPCLHTFCCGCLEKWTEEQFDNVKCPVCKESVVLPPEGVSGLRTNFFMTTFKEKEVLKSILKRVYYVVLFARSRMMQLSLGVSTARKICVVVVLNLTKRSNR